MLNKRKRSALSMAALAAISVLCLSACGNSSSNTETEAQTTAQTEAQTEEQTEEAVQTETVSEESSETVTEAESEEGASEETEAETDATEDTETEAGSEESASEETEAETDVAEEAETEAETEAATEAETEENTQTAVEDGYLVTFDLNYEDAPEAETQTVAENNVPETPEDPTREHYSFTGWYNEADCTSEADFEYVITADTTFYAGWELSEATVTFYMNDGTDDVFTTETVEKNGTATEPVSVPSSDGYLFEAWYQDADCSESFDFTTMITEDVSVYAGWTEDDGSSVLVTYMWNYDDAPDDGVYRSQRVAYKSYLSLPTPDRGDDYKFIYWYTDPDCTTYYDSSEKISEDTTLYAKWYNCVVFEAEYTDVSGITGYGYSGSLSGTKIINRDQDGVAGASNGWYVSYLYYSGITLTFNIHADEAVENALLYLRLSAEYYDLDITDDDFLVLVNGEQVEYGSISIAINNAGSSGGVTSSSVENPFQDYLVSQTLSLEEGDNVIQLVVNNFKPESERTGTMYSYAPVVDAIKICADGDLSSITWADGFPLESNLETANTTYD